MVTGGVTGVAENQIKVKEINDGGGKEKRLKKKFRSINLRSEP